MTRQITLLDEGTIPAGIDWPEPAFPHRWRSYDATAPAQRIERLRDAQFALTNKVAIDRDVLEACPQLELVAVVATGVDNVDLDACREAGVHVSNVGGYAGRAVAEWCLNQLLDLCWSQGRYRREQAGGGWTQAKHFNHPVAPIRELGALRVGILGRGHIGRALEQRLLACESRVEFLERPGAAGVRDGHQPFFPALGELDALVLCCPSTPQNTGLIDAAVLRRMKAGALLLNPSRGALLNEPDVAAALSEGRLGGLAVDVLGREPAEADNPLYRLRELPNVIITPHIAWCSRESVIALLRRTIENLNRFAEGDRSFCLV